LMGQKGRDEPLTHRRFLEQLLAQTEGKNSLAYKLLPSFRDYIGADVGVGGLSFRYVVGEDRSRIELYIARKEAIANKKLFDELCSHKTEIEAAFGEELSWERLDGSKSCRVAHRMLGGVNDEPHWQEIQTALIDGMVRLEKAILPFIGT
jgi:hypothetical protein